MTSKPISAEESYILNVKQQRKHFMFDWQKRLQLLQEIISSLTYYEGLTCHRFIGNHPTTTGILGAQIKLLTFFFTLEPLHNDLKTNFCRGVLHIKC